MSARRRPPKRPHRLEAKDTTLSRWRHGFEPRWGCQRFHFARAGFGGRELDSQGIVIVRQATPSSSSTPGRTPRVLSGDSQSTAARSLPTATASRFNRFRSGCRPASFAIAGTVRRGSGNERSSRSSSRLRIARSCSSASSCANGPERWPQAPRTAAPRSTDDRRGLLPLVPTASTDRRGRGRRPDGGRGAAEGDGGAHLDPPTGRAAAPEAQQQFARARLAPPTGHPSGAPIATMVAMAGALLGTFAPIALSPSSGYSVHGN